MRDIQILAVDDQISSLLALEDILDSINARLIKTSSAKAALMILLKEPIDCILLDVSMPGMDGFEFLKTLHSAPAHAKIPVLMITGKIFSENETLKAYKLGAVDFLLKPLDPQTVYRKVSFIVQQAQRINSIRSMEVHLNQLQMLMIAPLEAMIKAQGKDELHNAPLIELLDKLQAMQNEWSHIKHVK